MMPENSNQRNTFSSLALFGDIGTSITGPPTRLSDDPASSERSEEEPPADEDLLPMTKSGRTRQAQAGSLTTAQTHQADLMFLRVLLSTGE
jgi:hypothetical protein